MIEGFANWKRIENKDLRYAAFEAHGYVIEVSGCEYRPGGLRIEARPIDKRGYLPAIIVDNMFNEDFQRVEIQTTAYGALGINDIDKVIDGYKQVQALAKEIKLAFPQCF